MNFVRTQQAVKCCQEFLARIEKLTPDDETAMENGFPNKRVAAVKRASLDLTRALAEMRKLRP